VCRTDCLHRGQVRREIILASLRAFEEQFHHSSWHTRAKHIHTYTTLTTEAGGFGATLFLLENTPRNDQAGVCARVQDKAGIFSDSSSVSKSMMFIASNRDEHFSSSSLSSS